MKKFCDNCFKEVNCEEHSRLKDFVSDNEKIKYLERYYVCDECKEEFYDDLYDYNLFEINKEFRKLNGIVFSY